MLLSDEGAGVQAVAELLRRYIFSSAVEVVDGGTMGYELLPYLEGKSHLIIIDAVQSERAPGTTMRIVLDDPPSFFRKKLSPHQIGLADIFALASMTGELPGYIVLLAIVPENLNAGIELSPAVLKNLDRLVEMVEEELAAIGCPFQKVC